MQEDDMTFASLKALGALLVLGLAPQASANSGTRVDAAIVLAIDVSGSMDVEELAVQRAGYLEALRHPDLIRIVENGRHKRIAISLFEWAGDVRDDSSVSWRVIDGPAAIEAFAREVEAAPIETSFGTSISRAIHYAMDMIETADFQADAWLIDVSGDGPNNIGPPVAEARDRALDRGVTINGLPIMIRPSRGAPDLGAYYEDCVIGGLGAFVLPAASREEIAPAIRRKLFRELIGAIDPPDQGPGGEAKVWRASVEAQTDCLVGERLRMDPTGG
jgi:hypothetical protein